MNKDTFLKLIEHRTSALYRLTATKGEEYTNSDDQFGNFNRQAQVLGIDRKQVLMVYLSKHLDAIQSYVRTGRVHSEPISGRIADALLYLLLLDGMVEEEAFKNFPQHTQLPQGKLHSYPEVPPLPFRAFLEAEAQQATSAPTSAVEVKETPKEPAGDPLAGITGDIVAADPDPYAGRTVPQEVMDMFYNENIPAAKAWRIHKGLSLEECAEKMGMSPERYHARYESTKTLSETRRVQVAMALDVTAGQLNI